MACHVTQSKVKVKVKVTRLLTCESLYSFRPTQRTQRTQQIFIYNQRRNRQHFYPCVSAVASIASVAYLLASATFLCVACVCCIKKYAKASHCVRWIENKLNCSSGVVGGLGQQVAN